MSALNVIVRAALALHAAQKNSCQKICNAYKTFQLPSYSKGTSFYLDNKTFAKYTQPNGDTPR